MTMRARVWLYFSEYIKLVQVYRHAAWTIIQMMDKPAPSMVSLL
jgi:hypothetical protein